MPERRILRARPIDVYDINQLLDPSRFVRIERYIAIDIVLASYYTVMAMEGSFHKNTRIPRRTHAIRLVIKNRIFVSY